MFFQWFSYGFHRLCPDVGYSPTVVEDFDRSELASKCGGSTSVPKARCAASGSWEKISMVTMEINKDKWLDNTMVQDKWLDNTMVQDK